MDKLPVYQAQVHPERPSRKRNAVFKGLLTAVLLATCSVTYLSAYTTSANIGYKTSSQTIPIDADKIIAKCTALKLTPGPSLDFFARQTSDRFEEGTPAVHIRNATLWTGGEDGKEVLHGDILMARGIIKAVGKVDESDLAAYADVHTVDANGAWVTPGIVDVHSHLGVSSSPDLSGSDDTNSLKGLAMPWLRSVDGLNTHDASYHLSISGGVTTANVLPGSADAIGGQAFTLKLRDTKERTTTSRLLEPPFSLNATAATHAERPRWRQMKHACGENPSRVYEGTRMDTQWAFRQAYDTARKLKESQDQYCVKAIAGEWDDLGTFPEDLQWEALVDVLRGRVKVHNHCYEAVDLDNMVRLTNEFKFPIAAFHHAHETYLVPDLLKKAYGGPPAVALFATNGRYKREAWRGSEFAPRVLAENGLRVVMKSDHPVLDSRFLLNEAQQAHYYGLPEHLALSSVTSTSAAILGYDHRIGFLKKGYDADLVLWDSHPLQLGATPKQVFIDGIAQLKAPQSSPKPSELQVAPKTPDFDADVKQTLEEEGLPPLELHPVKEQMVVFTNVSSLHVRDGRHYQNVKEVFDMPALGKEATFVVTASGEVVCTGIDGPKCLEVAQSPTALTVDLEGGSISPALTSFGSYLGLNDIDQEPSANDGDIVDQLTAKPSSLLGQGPVIRAVDGLQFATRDALLAYRAGATLGVASPAGATFLRGLGTAFDTGAPHKLAQNAVVQDITALHISLLFTTPSISTQIGALRNLLKGNEQGDLGRYFSLVASGKIPLVIDVHSADVMASLIQLKHELEGHFQHRHRVRFTFVGANEAHLLAKEIARAQIGVIIAPRPFPGTWKSQRILPSHPLSAENAATVLRGHGVTVGLAVAEQWQSRNIRFDVGWTALDSNGQISKTQAIELATANLESLLGINEPNLDLVAVKHGSLHDFEGKVVGIISARQEGVNLL